MKKSGITIIYFVIGFIQIILQNNSSFYPGFISKALIIPVLILLFFQNPYPLKGRLNILMILGLMFSWAGDIFLEFAGTNGNMFIPGLVCFLMAHIMYLIVFITTPGKNSISGKRIFLLIPVILYGVGLVFYLFNDLAEMKLPVIIYAFIILSMLSAAINRLEKVNRKSFLLVFAGAALFVISDSAIAINKFSYKFECSGIVIMSTYIIAQYLIVTGYIEQHFKNKTDQIM